ncbi:CDP-alcohol phosphatidyltransferase family protein [Candidatus Woesearchaeota archaeon]|nr:CDP-alcohol phosphatidyltransferase family protein [Candidatus Woesearchaeota archaeon]
MNLPNALSYFRLVGTFVMLIFSFLQNTLLTIIFYVVLGLSDAVDGFIARVFNLETELGAKLDSLADQIFYYSSPIILYLFFPIFIKEQALIILIIIVSALLMELIHLIKHKTFGYLHLYSAKISALILYFFTLHSLIFNPLLILFYVLAAVLMFHFIEEIILVLIIKKPKSNMKSLFHYLWKK